MDTDEQIMAFQGLLRAPDGRANDFLSTHIWQWGMPGSDESLWNMDPPPPADQPDNVPVAQWLSTFAENAVSGFLGDMNGDLNVTSADVPAFIQALTDRTAYDAHLFPIDPNVNGDVNEEIALPTAMDIGGAFSAHTEGFAILRAFRDGDAGSAPGGCGDFFFGAQGRL